MEWKRPQGCAGGECVQVAMVGQVKPTVLIRNSRDASSVVIFTSEEWSQFLAAVRAGEFGVDAAANVS